MKRMILLVASILLVAVSDASGQVPSPQSEAGCHCRGGKSRGPDGACMCSGGKCRCGGVRPTPQAVEEGQPYIPAPFVEPPQVPTPALLYYGGDRNVYRVPRQAPPPVVIPFGYLRVYPFASCGPARFKARGRMVCRP
jgi:hypothetical protein